MRLVLSALLVCACAQARADFVDERSTPAAPAITSGAASASTVAPVQAGQAAGLAAAPAAAVFEVKLKDRSLREVLARWARDAGWVHEPSHWTIDRDFPVEGAAGADVFGPDFKVAVRRLLASTELTDRPVQPCFYTNHVVRVIPKAELCDKTQ